MMTVYAMMSALLPPAGADCRAFTLGADGTYDFGSCPAPGTADVRPRR